MEKARLKQNIKWISLVSAILIGAILLTLCIRLNEDNRFTLGGCSFFIVVSGSMSPQYPINTLVMIRQEPFEQLSEGDVIAYQSDALNKNYAFHRITRQTDEGFYTKGDNNENEDKQLITRQNYRGKCVYKSYILGLYLSTIKKPIGFLIYLALPILVLTMTITAIKRLYAKKILL